MDIFSIFFNMNVCCVFSFESPNQCDSNDYTQHTIINIKITRNYPKYNNVCSYEIFLLGTQERVRNRRGKLKLYCVFGHNTLTEHLLLRRTSYVHYCLTI